MKRKGNLYPIICDEETIKQAIVKASKGKRRRTDVQRVLQDKEKYAAKLSALLKAEQFIPSDYKTETIEDGSCHKSRDIFKPNFFPDQVVHWCIYLAIKDWIYKGMYEFTCGSIPGRGAHYGKKYVSRWIQKDHKGTRYYLKMDISKFYPSIPICKLVDKLNRKLKDKQLMRLISLILSKCNGLPIGMLLSQVFANYYLTDIDHYIKQDFKAAHYLRYMDDMVIFGRNKRQLHKMRKTLDEKLNENGLRMKGNWQICRLDKEPLDFMGFRFYRDHVSLRRAIMLSITRKIRKVHRKGRFADHHDASAVISYLGWIKHTDSYGLFNKWIKPYLHLGRMKNIVRRKQRETLYKQQHCQTAGMGQVQRNQDLSQLQRRRSTRKR